MCAFQFYLEYVLGRKGRPNFKTEKGSIVHKALELLAYRKQCEQSGEASFDDRELGLTFAAADVTPQSAVDAAWKHYTTKNESGHNWGEAEYADCKAWTFQVIDFRGGMFNPLQRNVVCPERYFDLTIDEPWAHYAYKDPHTGEPVRGQLAIKGSIDLITEVSPDTLEYLDWKSGRPRWDWAKDREKTYRDLQYDPQLLLYFYALTRLYPQYKHVFVTIFYAQEGPNTICYEQERHVPFALNLIRKRFEQIKHDGAPRRIMDDPAKRWKCKSFCYFGRNNWEGSRKSICNHLHDEVQQLGLERVMKKHGKPGAYAAYGSGGGVSNRDEKEKVATP
jgi:hypothetical protein